MQRTSSARRGARAIRAGTTTESSFRRARRDWGSRVALPEAAAVPRKLVVLVNPVAVALFRGKHIPTRGRVRWDRRAPGECRGQGRGAARRARGGRSVRLQRRAEQVRRLVGGENRGGVVMRGGETAPDRGRRGGERRRGGSCLRERRTEQGRAVRGARRGRGRSHIPAQGSKRPRACGLPSRLDNLRGGSSSAAVAFVFVLLHDRVLPDIVLIDKVFVPAPGSCNERSRAAAVHGART